MRYETLRSELGAVDPAELTGHLRKEIAQTFFAPEEAELSTGLMTWTYPAFGRVGTELINASAETNIPPELSIPYLIGGLTTVVALTKVDSAVLQRELGMVDEDEYTAAIKSVTSRIDDGIIDTAASQSRLASEFPALHAAEHTIAEAGISLSLPPTLTAAIISGSHVTTLAFKEMFELDELKAISS